MLRADGHSHGCDFLCESLFIRPGLHRSQALLEAGLGGGHAAQSGILVLAVRDLLCDVLVREVALVFGRHLQSNRISQICGLQLPRKARLAQVLILSFKHFCVHMASDHIVNLRMLLIVPSF